MLNANKNLETILRTVRSKATNSFEEQILIKDLLQIIYKRQDFGLNICQTTFAAIFLRQSGLEVDDRLAFDEYNAYRQMKAIKYKPHIKLVIKNLKVINENLQKVWLKSNNKLLELFIITSIDENRKLKKKFRFNETTLRSGVNLQIDSEFIHPLTEKSDNIWIRLCFSCHQNKCRKLFCGFCQINRIFSKTIYLEGIKGMPLTGLETQCRTNFATNNSSESLLQIEVDLKVEFTDEPKQNLRFKAEKLNSHINLLNKIYNRWSMDTIPSQIKALIELSRQQNDISSEENYILEENILQKIQTLSDANKKRKEFFNLINRAPTPQSNDFSDDNDNNNSSGYVPPIQDNKVFDLLNHKKKVKVISQ